VSCSPFHAHPASPNNTYRKGRSQPSALHGIILDREYLEVEMVQLTVHGQTLPGMRYRGIVF